MGVLDWMKRGAGKRGAEVAPAAAPRPVEKSTSVGGLDFGGAMEAHMKWRQRLESYIDGSSMEELKLDTVCRDDQCALGKWIYNDGVARFGYLETFAELKDLHARFHRHAGEVLSAAQSGRRDDARNLLRSGDYVRASERVKLTLSRLFVLVSDGKAATQAHLRWKTALREFVEGRGRQDLTAAEVVRDDQCALGQWVNGVGRERYGSRPAFGVVRERHAYVHRCGADVVAVALGGDRGLALQMLEEGEFARVSEELVAALRTLFEPA